MRLTEGKRLQEGLASAMLQPDGSISTHTHGPELVTWPNPAPEEPGGAILLRAQRGANQNVW